MVNCQCWCVGERGCSDGFTRYAWLSSIALLPWLPGFPPQAFPTTTLICLSAVNSSPYPGIAPQSLNSSSQSLHLPGDWCPFWGMYGCSKDCMILIPFRLPQIAVSLEALNVSPLTQTIAPMCGARTPASVPPPTKGRSSPTNNCVFCPSSFILLSFAWFYILFSTGQLLLSTVSWCSAYTSVSEGVFLMYPLREMYSTPNYSSTILFSLIMSFDAQKVLILMKSNLFFPMLFVFYYHI